MSFVTALARLRSTVLSLTPSRDSISVVVRPAAVRSSTSSSSSARAANPIGPGRRATVANWPPCSHTPVRSRRTCAGGNHELRRHQGARKGRTGDDENPPERLWAELNARISEAHAAKATGSQAALISALRLVGQVSASLADSLEATS